ncbi:MULTISPECIES: hypothetical protein [unclassified Pseudoclavibacter]|uniref:hypothetical protein n=1 Tax=unclassified Pseudoclavibacter TaxID=2615177 RepID=UPI001BA4DBC0|nr:hypothetical protein [Pseudoclavibacter sp. Marseille-Q4354]MBS3177777.1 hypothetical protein [Pseudoclavibacter sp. Marseille-Q4354]
MRPELISKTEAEELLAPHLAALQKCIREAWADWLQQIKERPQDATLSKSSRARVTYDRIADRAEAYFDAVGVHTTRERDFLEVSLADGLVRLRFKKFRDGSLRTSGIPTDQALEIYYQQVSLEGMSVTYLSAGYLPDELGLELDKVSIVCSYAGKALWEIPLEQDAAGVAAHGTPKRPTGPSVTSNRPAAQEDQLEGL